MMPEIIRHYLELANTKSAVEYLKVVLRYVSAAADSVAEAAIQIALDTGFGDKGDEIMPKAVTADSLGSFEQFLNTL